MLLHLPTRKEDVELWCTMLFDEAILHPTTSLAVLEYAELIVTKSKTEFKMKQVKKLYETKLTKALSEFFHDPNQSSHGEIVAHGYIVTANYFAKKGFVSQSGILTIWKVLSETLEKNAVAVGIKIFVFIKKSSNYMVKIDNKKSIDLLIYVRDNINRAVASIVCVDRDMEGQTSRGCLQGAAEIVETWIKNAPEFQDATQVEASPKVKEVEETSPKPKTPSEELGLILKSNSTDATKMNEILDEIEKSKSDLKKLAKTFLESAAERSNIGQLAVEIDERIECRATNDHESSSFKEILLVLITNSFKKLPKFDQIAAESEERKQAEFLVRLTGELYIVGWVEETRLISCMDRLAVNDFVSDHQIEMLHMLLKIVSDEMIRMKQVGKCKHYCEVLNGIDKFNVNRLHCIKILKKILEVKNEVAETRETKTNFHEILENLSSENVHDLSQGITEELTVNDIDLLVIKASEAPMICAKLSLEIKETSQTFKELLMYQCQENLQIHVKEDNLKMISLAKFIGELYNGNLITDDFIKLSFDILFGANSSDVVTDSISVLIKKIGLKMETEYKEKLDNYFSYFTYVIGVEKDSYKSKMFTYFIELRKNNWICDDKTVQPIVDYQLKEFEEEKLTKIVKNLRLFEDDLELISTAVIRKVWEFVLQKPELISLCAKLLKDMNSSKSAVTDFMTKRHAAFCSIKDDQFTEAIERRLGQVIIFVGELFARDIVDDNHMEHWLEEKLSNHLQMVHAAQLSSLIGVKLQETENIQLRLQVIFLDGKVNQEMKKFKNTIRDEIEELSKVL